MMKNTGLLKWTTNNKINKNNKNSGKNWIHSADVLKKGHVVYLVKFLGSTEVSQCKGIEVVKEAIRKLRFNQQIKKSEGTKTPKVELTISIDGVAVQQPKSKKILNQYPLHNISYCADDKAEKRFFSFIAKEADKDIHTCYVFVSDKLAEEITLTIGQAFDLAYRRFLETSSREIDLQRQIATLQNQLRSTQNENAQLRAKLGETIKTGEPSGDNLIQVDDVYEEPPSPSSLNNDRLFSNLPPVPPRNGTKTELIIEALLTPPPQDDDDDSDFDPRASEASPTNRLAPAPNFADSGDDDFDPRADENEPNLSFNSFKIRQPDEARMTNGVGAIPSLLPPPPSRNNNVSSPTRELDNDPFALHNDNLLENFDEMKIGFNRGISFGTTDDFTLESLDPLKN